MAGENCPPPAPARPASSPAADSAPPPRLRPPPPLLDPSPQRLASLRRGGGAPVVSRLLRRIWAQGQQTSLSIATLPTYATVWYASSPARAGELTRWVEENLRAGPDGKPFRMLPFRSPRGGGGGCRRSLRLVDDMFEEARGFDSPAAPSPRCFPKSPERVLDAPGVAQDFYLNLMDWGKENILAMAIGPGVYRRKEDDTREDLLLRDSGSRYPTSVAWSCDGRRLAVGFKLPD